MIRLLLAFLLLCLPAAPALAQNVQLTLEGKAIQGGLMRGKTVPGASVLFDGKSMRVAEDGGFLIGFGREAPAGIRRHRRATAPVEESRAECPLETRDAVADRRLHPPELARSGAEPAVVDHGQEHRYLVETDGFEHGAQVSLLSM